MFPNDAGSQALLAAANAKTPLEGVGTIIHRSKCLMRAVYDFTTMGGAVSTISLVDDQGNPATLPKGAIVTNVVAHVAVAVTSSAVTGLALNLLTAGDMQASQVKATLALGAFVAGVPVGTAATWVGPVTAVGGTQLAVTIITTAITAGKVYYFVEYVISSAT